MTNVKLSQEEKDLVTNAGIILTKNRIIGKVYDLFGELSNIPRSIISAAPAEAFIAPPKISRGENYQGLPWVMLDYPRGFSKADTFAIRCFFWWGNFFSVSLQLEGAYQAKYASALSNYRPSSGEWWVAVANDPWKHHFNADTYVPWTNAVQLTQLPFLKLTKKIPLQEWDNVVAFYSNCFLQIQNMLSADPVK